MGKGPGRKTGSGISQVVVRKFNLIHQRFNVVDFLLVIMGIFLAGSPIGTVAPGEDLLD